MRGSRVTYPARRSAGFIAGSKAMSARVMPCRTASAWALTPPPATFATTRKRFSVLVTRKASSTMRCQVDQPKYSSIGLPLMMTGPESSG